MLRELSAKAIWSSTVTLELAASTAVAPAASFSCPAPVSTASSASRASTLARNWQAKG